MQIYLSEVSIRRTVRSENLRPADLPRLAIANGFAGLELVDRMLAGWDADEQQSFAQACRETGCGFAFDVTCDLTYEDESAWRVEIDHVKRMIALASQLNAKVARIWLGGAWLSVQKLFGKSGRAGAAEQQEGPPPLPRRMMKRVLSSPLVVRLGSAVLARLPSPEAGSEPKIDRATQALQEILPAAIDSGLPLAIENHWGISSRPETILRIVEGIDSPYLGTCPDFSNFPRSVDRYAAIEILAPRASIAHAKSARFRPDGEEREIDYARALGALRGSGFDGILTVEYIGGGDELEGCGRTRDLIGKHWQPARTSTRR